MKETSNLQFVYRVGLVVIALLGLWSWLWYKERMTFLDPALITFTIINTKSLAIMEHRYGSFITHLVPYLGYKAGLSLATILKLYSVSFYIFYFIVYLLIGKYLKQKWLSILLVLYLTTLVSDTYFWPNNEVHQGIAWSILGLGFWWGASSKYKYFGILFLAMGISCHNLVGFPILLITLGYAYFNDYKKELSLIGIILFLIVLRYFLSKNSWYDGEKLNGLNKFTLQDLKIWQSIHLKSVLDILYAKFYFFYLLILACIWSLRKNIVWLLATIGFGYLYILLITLVFKEQVSSQNLFYFESEWMPFAIIICFSIVYKGLHSSLLYTYLICISLFSSLSHIYMSKPIFQARYNVISREVDRLFQEKTYKCIYVDDAPEKYLNTYNLAIESATISALKGHQPIVTFKHGDTLSMSLDQHLFKSSFKDEFIDTLNYSYYPLDTTTQYCIKKGSK